MSYTLQRARPRRVYEPHRGDRVHRVVTDSHDGPADKALCNATASRGWVMDPVNVEDCARCVALEPGWLERNPVPIYSAEEDDR